MSICLYVYIKEEVTITTTSLRERCLEVIGAFETSHVGAKAWSVVNDSGFDGMGISAGILQWNEGQGTLQPLLKELGMTLPLPASLISAKLGSPEGRMAQVRAAEPYFKRASRIFKEYGFVNTGEYLMCLSIAVQCGSVKASVAKKMLDYQSLPHPRKALKLAQLVAGSVNPRWMADVYSRLECCLKGHGTVHGRLWNLGMHFKVDVLGVLSM
jgi:hypothetical protein